ncbi:MAG: hypothetical protein JO355_10860 [Planctomycetaceae bacterium]|nr:hypothetical protein [Planctomycetaceae bacterium]MBV8677649.1 hypothetical protein [Planctomycetaceae bacterium]
MSYSDFTLEGACRAFMLELKEDQDLFADLPGTEVGPGLRALLDEYVPLATAIHTEKARSEFIVAPILAEVRRLMGHRISLFSGVDFTVAPDQGLNGTCDFILAASPVQLFLRAPVLTVVVAENDNIKSGLGQCVAEMVAARIFNEREREGPSVIHGAVTTGSLWRFLKLEGGTVFVDQPEYYLDRLEKVLAILIRCVGG